MPKIVRVIFIDILGQAMLVYKKPSECFNKKRRKMPIKEALRYLDDHFKGVDNKKNVKEDKKITCNTVTYKSVMSTA